MLQIIRLLVYLLFAAGAALIVGTIVMSFMLRRRFPALWAQWGSPESWLWLGSVEFRRSLTLDFH